MPTISLSGDKELNRVFKRLEAKTQKKIVRKAIRNGAKRAKARIVSNIKSRGLIKSGRMLSGFERAKIRSASRNPRKTIRIGPELPSRADLNIDPADKSYYPYALEKRKPFIRPAIDDHLNSEFRTIGREIGSGIESEASR